MKNALIVLGAIAFAAVVFFFIRVAGFYQKIYSPKSTVVKKAPVEKNAYNILLLGYGGGSHDGTYLTDTMILAHIDLKKKIAVLISIPRDVWVKIPTKSGADFHTKINSVYEMELFPEQYPDVQDKDLTSKIVGGITGLPVDNYVTVDFDGFVKAVDILGGVDVNVEKSFTDVRYPIDGKEKDLCEKDDQFKQIEPYLEKRSDPSPERDAFFKDHADLKEFFDNIEEKPQEAFPCRYETLSFTKGTTHMDGTTALKYARSRYGAGDGGDFGRAARQQRVIEAVKKKVLSIGFIPKIIPLLSELENHIKTDIPGEQMRKFLDQAPGANEFKIINLVMTDNDWLKGGRSEDGQFILIPEAGEDTWSGVRLWLKNAVNGVIITPSPSSDPLQKKN